MSTRTEEMARRVVGAALEEAKRNGELMGRVLAEAEAGAGRFYVRFPKVDEGAARLLAKALDYERCAADAVLDGDFARAEHLRGLARAAWSAVRGMGRNSLDFLFN